MRVVIVGCGRVGAGLAVSLATEGNTVAVVDKDRRAFDRLGEDFGGDTVEGIGFDRDVPEAAGVGRADALVAVTSGDNSNVVTARVARETYRVPRVIARIHDPRRAAIYEQLGIVTVSSTDWALRKVRDYLEHRTLKEEAAFGRGEVSVYRLELPQHLVDTAVSAPAVLTWLLDSAVGVQDVVTLLRAGRGGRGIALVEVTLDEDAPAVGRPPAELGLPAGAALVAVVRGDEVLPGGQTGPLEAGDEVLAVTTWPPSRRYATCSAASRAAPTRPADLGGGAPSGRVHCGLWVPAADPFRDVAQLGSAPRSGRGGPGFKSRHPDH
jgi:trk system potassium uptake protein